MSIDPKLTFWTKAPDDAPEVRGHSRYFSPERLEWIVRPGLVYVIAHGPGTRAGGQGSMGYSVEGHAGDESPEWIAPPTLLLDMAAFAVEGIAAEVES